MSIWKDSIKGLIIEIINKKFVVFVLGTIFFMIGKLSEANWLYLAGGYMAANFVERVLDK